MRKILNLKGRKPKLEEDYECINGRCTNRTPGLYCDTCKRFSKMLRVEQEEINRQSRSEQVVDDRDYEQRLTRE